MVNTLNSAEALIRLQGQINALIMDLSRQLTERPGIKLATRMCEVRTYQQKTIFEACVDVETNNDRAVSFWFELGCESNQWHVAASISRTVRDGQDRLKEYPEALAASFEQLEKLAIEAADWLVKNAEEFDFQPKGAE